MNKHIVKRIVMKCKICRTCCSKIDFRNKDVIIKKNCCRDLPIDIDRLKGSESGTGI